MIRFVAASALVLAAGAAAASPAMTAHRTSMRAAPSSRAHIVQRIPAHAQIDISDCGEYWCSASWRNLDGYVRVEAIAANTGPLAPAAAPPPYGYGYGYGGPYYGSGPYYGGPYVGGPVVVGPAFGFGFYRHW
jgi:hypothetical protein